MTKHPKIHQGKKTLVLAVSLGLLLGIFFQRSISPAPAKHDHETDLVASEEAGETVWTCSMHPQFKLPKPGNCPICFMDLIPLESGGDNSGGEREISVSPYAAKLMELETSEVIAYSPDSEIRLVGKVDYDETRVSYIAAWVPGRLDRLYVNYTGIPVKKGDRMVEIYSPDLLTAQEELIQALIAVDTLRNSNSRIVRNTAESTVNAAREKLRLLGLAAGQIRQIELNRKAADHITLGAPNAGIVIHKNAQEGMYVQTGTLIYTIADLSSVWVKLDAYESDLDWIRHGGTVEFTTETYPGKIFQGMISFIDPIIDPATRTAKVRVSVSNESLALKPGMFVRAVAKSTTNGNGASPPLVIPITAAMKTGKRAVVYREITGQEKPTYEGREVMLGARIGNFYVVESGLEAGDRVVTRGAFKLDAELQIQARPSMMSDFDDPGIRTTDDTTRETASEIKSMDAPAVFRGQVGEVLDTYYAIQTALAADKPSQVIQHAKHAQMTLGKVDENLLKGNTLTIWKNHGKILKTALEKLAAVKSLEKQRETFQVLSKQMTTVIRQFSPEGKNIFRAFCPMAFDNKGAYWLQDNDRVTNPYFGDMMLRCGEIKETISKTNELTGVDNG